MTPQERKTLEIEIYLEIHKPEYSGCITNAADFLRHNDSSRISRLVNPNDRRANNIFGEFVDVLQGFHYKHPALAKIIWQKITLAVNSFMDADGLQAEFAELIAVADRAAREQLDVNHAINCRKSPQEIEEEAFQAYEYSRLQYEKAAANNRGQSRAEIQTGIDNVPLRG